MTKHNQVNRLRSRQGSIKYLNSIPCLLKRFLQEVAMGQSALVAAFYSLQCSTQKSSCLALSKTTLTRLVHQGESRFSGGQRRTEATRIIEWRWFRSAATIVLMVCLISTEGCQVGPRYVPPSMQAPPAFKEVAPQQSSDGTIWTAATPQDSTLRFKWWELYQEPELNALEEKLNISNQNVAQSFQNFMAARAQVKQARASYYPTISVGPSYTRGRTASSVSGAAPAGSNTPNPNSNTFDLPFDVSWEPDVWGKIRNTVRQYANAAQVSAADLANERLSEQANLAEYYFELRGQDALIDLYQKTEVAYQKNLELTQIRSKTGVDTEQSVAQAELSLRSAIASTISLRIARAQYEHAIALLVGESASSFSMPIRGLVTKVPPIPIGVPSLILQRRPDIAAAERTMAEANALIGVEKAAYYPSFNIGGDLGLQSSKIGSLFDWPSRYFSVGPSASETLFDGGLRRGLLNQYKAQYEADAAAYREAALTAFQQVEDYLASDRWLDKQREQQQDVIDAAQRYYDLADVRYRTGVDTYLNVFTAEASLLGDQQTAITLHVQEMTSSIQLIEALGGGWDTSQLPTERAVAAK